VAKKKNIPLWLRSDIFFDGNEDSDVIGNALATKAPAAPAQEKETPFVDDGKQEMFTVAQIASLWQLSTDTIQRMFEDEAGVQILGNKNPRGKRKRVTLRIPREVMQRVKRRMANK